MSDFNDVAYEYIKASEAIVAKARLEAAKQSSGYSDEFERLVEAEEIEDHLYRMLRKQARELWDCEDAFVARFLSSG
jgi:hypothetical protein